MSGAVLSIHDPAARLTFRAGKWRVLRGGKELRAIRAHEIAEIWLHGPVDLGPAARAAALARDVPLVLLTADGRYRGRFQPRDGIHARRALAQLRWLSDDGARLDLARSIVAGKIRNQRRFLVRVQQRRRSDAIASAAASLRHLLQLLERAPHLDAVRGIEGRAAAEYFGAWSDVITHPRIRWSRRTRRPPRDETNACLSFGYTLLAVRVRAAIQSAGLVPTLGALHEMTRDQEALVFDLVEEFRTVVVDAVVVRLINRQQLDRLDFEDPRHRQPDLGPGRPSSERGRGDEGPAAGDGADGADLRPGGDAGDNPGADIAPSRMVYLAPSGRRLLITALNRRWRDRLDDHRDPGSRRTIADLLDRQVWHLSHVFEGREERYSPLPHP